MSKNHKSRKEQFAINIRKNHVQAYKKQKRKSFYNPNCQLVLADLVKQFQFDSTQNKFQSKEMWQSLIEILQLRFQSLVKINFKQYAMFDQKQTTQNTQVQFQPVLLPKQYPINVHVNFYNLLACDIYKNPTVYKQKQILEEFILKYIQRNKYKQISVYKQYQLQIINVFELIVANIQNQMLKKKILHWVQGTASLNLIFNCLTKNQFLFLQGYQNIYTIVQKGLNLPIQDKNQQALDILQRLLKKADYDDIVNLLHNHIGIQINLLNLSIKSFGKPIIIQCVRCLVCLIDTYDSCALQSVKFGVGLIASKLICSLNQEELKIGLQLFRMITISSQRGLYDFLLKDSEINQSGVWQMLGKSLKIYKSANIQIRKNFSFIFFNIISNSGYEEIVKLSDIVKFQNNEDLLEMFISTIFQQEDPLIILNALNNLKTILYYSEQFGDKQQLQNSIFERILQSKLEVRIAQLSKSENITLRNQSEEFLNYMQKKAVKST